MNATIPKWITELSEEDWHFIKRLILASGSLKDVARDYNISYPTVRIRLNRLIGKIQLLDSDKPRSEFHRKIQIMVAEGLLDLGLAKSIIKAHETDLNERIES